MSGEDKGWIGERYDAGVGLQYLNARYYDPELAVFIQPDWFEVTKAGVGTNRYAYSFNDPVNLRDPEGNCVWDACIVEGIIVAAGALIGTLMVDHAIDVSDGKVDGSSPLGNPAGALVGAGLDLALEGISETPGQESQVLNSSGSGYFDIDDNNKIKDNELPNVGDINPSDLPEVIAELENSLGQREFENRYGLGHVDKRLTQRRMDVMSTKPRKLSAV
ncbi:RHS repeat-associated core domain-containing protein, partial [Primorskyibacter sp. 2E233]|uniref:RHS repeat-associated core domain-containing protein n=1 Tax=Primorskyibacter sp. 2E233 TaxID=3413431 RepID=UPI003BF0C173